MATGLRDRKKAQTRARIAEVAARLFAEHGYERVTVTGVARAAEVAEKTVYNYFPTKEHLVLDRDDEERDEVVGLIAARSPGTSPAQAIRAHALAVVDEVRHLRAEDLRGYIGYLSAISPAIHRQCLDMADRHAAAFAAAILGDDPDDPAADRTARCRAKVLGVALAWVYQTIIDESGRLTVEGRTPTELADELAPIVAAVLDDIDHLPVPEPG